MLYDPLPENSRDQNLVEFPELGIEGDADLTGWLTPPFTWDCPTYIAQKAFIPGNHSVPGKSEQLVTLDLDKEVKGKFQSSVGARRELGGGTAVFKTPITKHLLVNFTLCKLYLNKRLERKSPPLPLSILERVSSLHTRVLCLPCCFPSPSI